MLRFPNTGTTSRTVGTATIPVTVRNSLNPKNVSNCKNGTTPCDPSRLTKSEAREWAISEQQRNIGDCQDGFGACERSKLTPPELMGVDIALRRRNLSDC